MAQDTPLISGRMLRSAAFLAGLHTLAGGGCMPPPAGTTPASLLYVLQTEDFTASQLAAASFGWLVLEPSRDGTAAGDLSAAELSQIHTGGACAKTLLAYLSIGEAEDYRDYWNPAWVDGGGNPIPGVAPAWLGPQNNEFPGNYKVRFWDPAWQAVILTGSGGAAGPLDRIIDQGFDGVYLDIIDAYEFWSSADGGNERTRAAARQDMIEFVMAIAQHARGTRGRGDFLVFPQNAADIIRDDGGGLDALTDQYLAVVSGIGQEDLFYNETAAQDSALTEHFLAQLREFRARQKTVLVTDYIIDAANPTAAANNARLADFYARCLADGLIPYAARSDRNLDEIVTTASAAGFSVDQPSAGCGS